MHKSSYNSFVRIGFLRSHALWQAKSEQTGRIAPDIGESECKQRLILIYYNTSSRENGALKGDGMSAELRFLRLGFMRQRPFMYCLHALCTHGFMKYCTHNMMLYCTVEYHTTAPSKRLADPVPYTCFCMHPHASASRLCPSQSLHERHEGHLVNTRT